MEFFFSDRVISFFTAIFISLSAFSLLAIIGVKFDKIKYKCEFIFIFFLLFALTLISSKLITHFYLCRAVFSDLAAMNVKTIDSFQEIWHKSSLQGIGFVVNKVQELEYPSSAPHFYSVYHFMRHNKKKESRIVRFYPKTWSNPYLYQVEAGNKIIVSFHESVDYHKKWTFFCAIIFVIVISGYLLFRVIAIKAKLFFKLDKKML